MISLLLTACTATTELFASLRVIKAILMAMYSLDFKMSAVLGARHSGRSLAYQAGTLGISSTALWNWTNDDRFQVCSRGEAQELRDEVAELRQQLELVRESRSIDFASKQAIFAFIASKRRTHTVELLCRTFEVSESGYFAWVKRKSSAHDDKDVELMFVIESIFEKSRATYGSPRIHAELVANRWKVSRKRVSRIMRELGLSATVPRPFTKTTLSEHDRRIAPNLLQQDFSVKEQDRVWVADITYIWTDEGWLYLSMFLDLFARKIVGWSGASHMRDELVLESFDDALARRGAELNTSQLTVHSDRGSQYASDDFIDAMEGRRITRSMSARGCCFDNAVAESFFATLKKELVYRTHYRTRAEALASISDYIELFYNPIRRHSTNQYFSPDRREEM